jgi:hypothetical protein
MNLWWNVWYVYVYFVLILTLLNAQIILNPRLIRGSHSSVAEASSLLGCDSASLGK